MITLKLIIDNNKIKLKIADTFFKKTIGLAFKKNIDFALRFRCNGIHTFFMKVDIDVVLTDKNNNVIHIYKNLKKNKIIIPKKGVFYTYELPCGTIKNTNIKKLEIEI